MSRFNLPSDVFIPRCWQVAPMLPHGYIARDRIYDIYTAQPRNWNPYYEPSYTRVKEIRKMSRRIVQQRQARRHTSVEAAVYVLPHKRFG